MVTFEIHEKDTNPLLDFFFFTCINRIDLENWSLLMKDTVKKL